MPPRLRNALLDLAASALIGLMIAVMCCIAIGVN